MEKKVDILAFGPHPDDVEFGCGGLLIRGKKLGYSIGIVDMTKGEMSTNGTIEERAAEAQKAAEILGASVRVNLGLPNNFLFNTKETQDAVIRALREYKPRLVLLPYHFDRHPDHVHASEIIRDAIFTAGLRKYDTGQEKHRPTHVLYYSLWNEFEPSFVLDVSEEWPVKIQALLVHESQFGSGPNTIATIDNSSEVREYWDARGRRYGFMIGTKYGEPYLSVYQPIGLTDPLGFLPNLF